MNDILVYCEVNDNREFAEVSLELCSKARKLADELKVQVDALVLCDDLNGAENQLFQYGVDRVILATSNHLFPYRTLPHFSILVNVVKQYNPQILLLGATHIGRDLAPRVASRLSCGLTADCTNLEVGSYTDAKKGKEYSQLLYQIRPAFGGNIVATIVNPETRPQMATVREGVMKKEVYNIEYKGVVEKIDPQLYLNDEDLAVEIINREVEAHSINIKNAQIIVSGGYGVGSKENFSLLHKYASLIGGEVGATRAAVDAGFTEPQRQIGQTGVTVRPKLYVACGISGAVQHCAGMTESAKIISINTDPLAPINAMADYVIVGDVTSVLEKLIKCYSACQK